MLTCKILKLTNTTRGACWPGPHLVALPDQEARALEARGLVRVVEPPQADILDREQQPHMDRRQRRRMSRDFASA